MKINTINLAKFCLLVFLLYINWFKETFSDVQPVLYLSVGLAILFCFISLEGRTPYLGKQQSIILRVFFLYAIYELFVSFFFSRSLSLSISSLTTVFEFLLVLYCVDMISNLEGNADWFMDIMRIVAIVCAAQAILFGKEFMNGVVVITMSNHNNPNALAFIMLFGIFTLVRNQKKLFKHLVLNTILIVAFLFVIIRSGSRKCLISVLMLIVFFIIEYFQSIKGRKQIGNNQIFSMILVAGIAFAFYYVKNLYSGSASYQRMIALETQDGVSSRITLYREAFELFQRFPIFGVGFDQVKVWSTSGLYSHSTYAEVLACGGIIGVLIFFVPILIEAANMLKYTLAENDPEIKYELVMLITGFLCELFLGIGQIWIEGFSHMSFLFFYSGDTGI